MKKSIKTAKVASLACLALLTACGENAWNNHLDGFEEPPVYNKTQTIEYTLTDADYSTLSGLAANKALAVTDEEKSALSAIGTRKSFATEDEARRYLPAFFDSSSFPYFTAIDKSSIMVTYNIAQAEMAAVKAIGKAPEYKVTTDNYIAAWQSDDNYIPGFAPMTPAVKFVPGFLLAAYPDAVEGDMVVANYNVTDANPVFGGVEEGPAFELTSVIATAEKDKTLDINGIVTGISTRGFVVTDASGSICYDQGNGFNDDAIAIGAKVHVTGKVGTYNQCYQISVDQSYEVVGLSEYKYPAPEVYDGAKVDQACAMTADFLATYIQLDCTVSVSGNYYNLIIDNCEHQGSVYNAPDNIKALFNDGDKVTVYGYFVCLSGKAKYFNVLVTAVGKPGANRAPATTMATYGQNSVYAFNGTEWTVPANVTVLQPADYTAMGQNYGNLSEELPQTLLPVYMNKNYPYAAEGDVMTVAYKYYASGSTTYKAREFKFSDGKWSSDNFKEAVSEQYNKINGVWAFDPSVTLVLPAVKGNAVSAAFYQACVNWVYENIDKPLGSTSIKSGVGYVTSYGNNDYYGGASAYQNNVDLRPSAALGQYAAGFNGMNDDQIVELVKYRFCYEVVPGALAALYPEAKPIEGLEVLYTIEFSAYTGTATTAYTGVWKVVGPAKFEFVSCTWWPNGTPE